MKNSLEVNLEKQLDELNKFVEYMTTMKFSGKPRFQKGLIIAIKVAIQLQKLLAEHYNSPTLTTASITQDFLESFFSIIRAMGGANTNPDTFMFLQRVKHYITQKILEDDIFDIFCLKVKLTEKRDLSDMDHDVLSDAILPEHVNVKEGQEVQDNLDVDPDEEVLDDQSAQQFEDLNVPKSKSHEIAQISYEQGIIHMAAAIASNFREDNLGTIEMKSEFSSQMYTTEVNR